MGTIENFRKYRSQKLEKLAKPLAQAGITANHLTLLSLASGIATIYFLFDNYYLLVVFAVLHLLFDSLDGVVARLTKPTLFGKYFDLLTDSSVTFLALVKTGWYLQDWYAYVAAGLFLVSLLIHLKSKLQAPMILMRTATLIVLSIATHPSFPYAVLTPGYLLAGGISVFSLAWQLQWYTKK